jgi:hypothetical protein
VERDARWTTEAALCTCGHDSRKHHKIFGPCNGPDSYNVPCVCSHLVVLQGLQDVTDRVNAASGSLMPARKAAPVRRGWSSLRMSGRSAA